MPVAVSVAVSVAVLLSLLLSLLLSTLEYSLLRILSPKITVSLEYSLPQKCRLVHPGKSRPRAN